VNDKKLLSGRIIVMGTGSNETDAIVTEADSWAYDLVIEVTDTAKNDYEFLAKLAALHGEIAALIGVLPIDKQKLFFVIAHSIIDARQGIGVHLGPSGQQ